MYLAYIDPNAGGMLFQIFFPIIIFIGGVWLFLKRKIYALFKKIFGPKDKDKVIRK